VGVKVFSSGMEPVATITGTIVLLLVLMVLRWFGLNWFASVVVAIILAAIAGIWVYISSALGFSAMKSN